MNTLDEVPLEQLQLQLAQLQQCIEAKKAREASTSRHDPSTHQLHAGVQHPAQDGLSHKRTALSRSKSTMGYGTGAGIAMTSRDSPEHQAPKRQRRTQSQQSHTQPMSRTMSNRSDSTMPFVQTGPIAPLSTPAGRYDLSSHPLPSVQEAHVLSDMGPDVGMSVGDYLMENPYINSSYLDTTRPNLSPDDAYNLAPSACPSMFSGTSAAEPPHLSRENSSYYEGYANPMVPSQSQATDSFDHLAPNMSQQSFSAQSYSPDKFATSDQVLLGISPFPSFGQAPMSTMSLSPASATMERTDSNSSVDSTKSTASKSELRLKEADERFRKASRTVIAPKPQEVSADNKTKSGQDAKVALPNRGAYQRPKHPKVRCDQCNDYPDGFRGDHELRRHISAKHHGGLVKKFVCRDPAEVGLQSTVTARHPLNKCKACVNGKEYGAYYNAAAHLRRTHFKPKPSRGKRGADEEKRGGMGGGDWPPMADLKLWFEEKYVRVDKDASLDDADENAQDLMLGSPEDVAQGVSPFDSDPTFGMYNGQVDQNASFESDESMLYSPYDTQIPGNLAEFAFAPASVEPSPAAFGDMGPLTDDQNVW